MDRSISRRNFVAGAAAAGALAAGAGAALADEAATTATDVPTATSPAFNAPSWATKPDPIADADIVETIETEVLVLGAGNAGCAAACSAVENGAKVLVCEKTAQVNGRGGCVGAVNSRLNKELGLEFDPIAAQVRWVRCCGSRANEALVTKWFRNSGPAMDWLLDKADEYGATYNLFAAYSKSEIFPEEPDGHKMGMWAGGVMQDGPLPTALHPQAYSMFHGPFMFVNKNGKRFFNEATWVQAKSLQMLDQPDAMAFSVFDSNFPTDVADSLQYGGGMFWDLLTRSVDVEFDPQAVLDLVESEAQQGKDVLGNEMAVTAWKCDTLEELADALGFDETAKADFLDQVERYNAACEAGEDDEFAKEAHFLYPIKQAPFYATKAGPCLLAVVGGLKVNTDLAVIDANGDAIPGLYAIGNTSGGTYAVDYPINVCANSNGRCLTWGWLVGKTVAAL